MKKSDIDDGFLTPNPEPGFVNFHATKEDKEAEVWSIRGQTGGPTTVNLKAAGIRLQNMILYAVAKQKRLRVVGSAWSFSDIGFAKDALILDTSMLTGWAHVPQRKDLLFVQAGTTIRQINRILEKDIGDRAMITSGASNGQTIAGAVSTGTHGSALAAGAMQNLVVGIQLITGKNNLWLEREGADNAVLNPAIASSFGAIYKQDNNLFDAALINLGGLGIVASYIVKTDERYLLETHRVKRKFSEISDALNTLNLSSMDLPKGSQPYFFMTVVDPNLNRDDAYVTVRYKKHCPADYPLDYEIRSGHGFNNELQSFFVKALQKFNLINPDTMSTALAWDQKEDNFSGTPGETYDVTSGKKGVLGAAIAFPVEFTSGAVIIARDVINSQPDYSPLVIALRFVLASDGLMSFTPFAKTCVMDIDGLQDDKGVLAMDKISDELEAADIPFTQHWGKSLNIDETRLRKSLGDEKVDKWIFARNRLLSTVEERFVFSNKRLIDLGLAT